MKVLLDECLPRQLKKSLRPVHTLTVYELGWATLKNGALMKVAIEKKFDILLTTDKNLEFQQNINSYNISIVILDVKKNTMPAIKTLLPKFLAQLQQFEKRKVYRIV